MQIPIFWRLIAGYSLILLLSIGVSSYSTVQLGSLSGAVRGALDTDNRMIAYQEKLTDAFLSEVRYAGRFVITHAASLHEQFRQFNNDFSGYIREVKSLATAPEIKARLSRVEELHLRYQHLFDQEVRYIKAGQPYAESRFQKEKEKVLETALGELERLKRQLHKNLNDKLESMDSAARAARTGAGIATLLLLALGFALSLGISKSITKPLATLKRVTVEAAEGDSAFNPEFYRVPEIQELSDALGTARRKLREAAETNSVFVHAVGEQLVMPLVSLKKRLSYLQAELTEKATAEQRTTFDVLADETERLIQRCAQLQSAPTEPVENRSPQQRPNLPRVGESLPSTDTTRKRRGKGLLARVEEVSGVLAAPWHAIFQSIRTVASGKARKR